MTPEDHQKIANHIDKKIKISRMAFRDSKILGERLFHRLEEDRLQEMLRKHKLDFYKLTKT